MVREAVRGWVYILSNPAMPNLVKVGFSMQDPLKRAQELDHTGTPHPYQVDYDVLVEEPDSLERLVHEKLSEHREGKEWFRCSVAEAVVAIRELAGGAEIAESWRRPQFVCQQCGHIAPRWLGQCPTCEAWATLIEAVAPRAPIPQGTSTASVVPIEIKAPKEES